MVLITLGLSTKGYLHSCPCYHFMIHSVLIFPEELSLVMQFTWHYIFSSLSLKVR